MEEQNMKLSSPCGDKLQFHDAAEFDGDGGYRPLAGISCNRFKPVKILS